jgi:tripartite ATP-independent transporter DctP family solute receptor
MMMLKKCRCLVLAMILVFVSCTTFAAAKKPIKLVYGHILPVDHYFCKGDQYFKELVEKNSRGRIIVDFYPASQLGSGLEQALAVSSGAQQMTCNGSGAYAQSLPKFVTLELPYLFRNEDHYLKVTRKLTSIINQKELATKLGVRILGARLQPPRHVSSNTPINKIEDMKGLKIRVPENASWAAFFRACGAIPISMPVADVYTALASGTIDGLEHPLDNFCFLKFYEQQKYIAQTGHIMNHFLMFISSNFWNGLTKTQKKIIQDAVDKSDDMVNRMVIKNGEKYKKFLEKKGIKFTKPDVAPFIEKAKPILKEFGDAELIKKINAIK